MKLTNEEIAKVFAMYLGCRYNYISGQIGEISLPMLHCMSHCLDKCKLFLTPLNKVTDEHEKERRSIPIRHNDFYLISKGYAVPLWFGIDHPCNGKTAIELCLAIDATTLKENA